VGCAASKVECGVDDCGKSYVDKTYRTYTDDRDSCKIKGVKETCTSCEKKQNFDLNYYTVQP
jgi:hypothetical protein